MGESNMVIQTRNRSYYVIRTWKENEETESFICRNYEEMEQERYLLVKIKHQKMVYQVLTFFMELKKKREKTDFIDCFNWEENFYAVFLYKEELLLKEKLQQEELNLLERLEIGKRLLEKQLNYPLPVYLYHEGLKNIMVSKSLEVEFNYPLEDITQLGKIEYKDVCKQLEVIFSILFRKEREAEISIQLTGFLNKLKQEQLEDDLQIYKEYKRVYEKLLVLQNEKIRPKNIWIRGWKQIKMATKFIKPVVAVVLLATCLFCLIETIKECNREPKEKVLIEKIGTIEVRQ